MKLNCKECGQRLALASEVIALEYGIGSVLDGPLVRASAVLLDAGAPGDGTGACFIVMPYVVSMSSDAGPYCGAHALRIVNYRNQDRWNPRALPRRGEAT